MKNLIKNFLNDEAGASAAEYALIVAVLGGFVVLGATAFGGSLQSAMTTTGNDLTSTATTSAG